MDEMLERIISEEAKNLGISIEQFKELANKGCEIAYEDDYETRIKRFGGLDFFDEEKLRLFMLTLIEGGAVIEGAKI